MRVTKTRRPFLLFLTLALVLAFAHLEDPSEHSTVLAAQAQAGVDPTSAAESPAGHGEEHTSPVSLILISLVVILMTAKVGGDLFERMHQPAVLGELVFGVLIGNLGLLGITGLDYLKSNEVISVLAEIGVIFLLFEVGLESNIKEMLEVGLSSFLVALFGVVAPMLLGLGVGRYFLPEAHPLVPVFIGATLCATSVGITARVLKDLGKINGKESRIILGAAVIDDVMGLVILAAVSGIIKAANRGGSAISVLDIGIITLKAIAFLVVAIWVGSRLSPRLFGLASRLRVRGMLLATSVSFCFVLAYLANRIELAPIVGAFAAGLILDPVHYVDFRDRGEHHLEELLLPITSFLVPIFFVLMGIRVDLRTFGHLEILSFAGILSLAAIVGKQVCSLGVMEKGLDRFSVGIGMIPRGEVGLIFAGIGTTLVLNGAPVISSSTYSAVVIMVIVTTLVTPPLLKWSLAKGERRKQQHQVQGAPSELKGQRR
ncbi:MAG: cation:proton antiporter [Acidobacteriota bacterium]